MPRLINRTDIDLFAPQIHRSVPPYGEVEITYAEAVLFENNSIFEVSDEPAAEDNEPEDESVPSASRRQVTRGAKRAEINTAPAMETR